MEGRWFYPGARSVIKSERKEHLGPSSTKINRMSLNDLKYVDDTMNKIQKTFFFKFSDKLTVST